MGRLQTRLRGKWVHSETWQNQMVSSLGTPVGITADGKLFIGSVSKEAPKLAKQDDVKLLLSAKPDGDMTTLKLTATSGEQTETVSRRIPSKKITGMFALTSHNGPEKAGVFTEGKWNSRGTLKHWFDQFVATGEGICGTPERQFGPIAFNQFSLSSGTLRMNAQLTPLDIKYTTSLTLEIQHNGSWRKVADADYHQASSSAFFLVPRWNTNVDVPYRIVWQGTGFDGQPYTHHYTGMVRKEPKDRNVVMGSFNCMFWTGFPYADSVSQMTKIQPDILSFTGDQLYEGAGGYGYIFGPYEDSRLNYFQHWFLHGLAFRELLANTPAITINDDHDVFHGNIWGEGGKAADMSQRGAANQQDTGGFKMYPQFVNLVQKSQCGHLPPFSRHRPSEASHRNLLYRCQIRWCIIRRSRRPQVEIFTKEHPYRHRSL